MPPKRTLEAFAATGTTLALDVSHHALEDVVARLVPWYGGQCPAAVAEWTLSRSALIFVGPALESGLFRDSALYDPAHVRRYRDQ